MTVLSLLINIALFWFEVGIFTDCILSVLNVFFVFVQCKKTIYTE